MRGSKQLGGFKKNFASLWCGHIAPGRIGCFGGGKGALGIFFDRCGVGALTTVAKSAGLWD